MEPSYAFRIAALVIFFTVFVIGMIGNFLVILVTLVNKQLRNVTNIFVTQLAIADCISLTLCLPYTVTSTYLFQYWTLPKWLCGVVKFSQSVAVLIIFSTLAVMSVERYIAIVHPLKALKVWKMKLAMRINAVLILICILGALPRPLWTKMPYVEVNATIAENVTITEKHYICTDVADDVTYYYNIVRLVVFFVTPLLVIIVSYSGIVLVLLRKGDKLTETSPAVQAKRKRVVVVLLAAVVCFVVCVTPFQVYILGITQFFYIPPDKVYDFTFACLLSLYINNTLNPFIFSFVSGQFRRQMYSIVRRPCLGHFSRQRSIKFPKKMTQTESVRTNDL